MYLGLIFLSMASKILTYPEGIYTQENIFRTKLYQTTGERLAKIRLLQTKHKLKVPLNKMQRRIDGYSRLNNSSSLHYVSYSVGIEWQLEKQT
jgi:hypothetical protein